MLGGNLKDFLSQVLTGGVILLWFQQLLSHRSARVLGVGGGGVASH